jgi:hypothetical protein
MANKGNNTANASSSKSEELTKHLEDVVKKAMAAVQESQAEENGKIEHLMAREAQHDAKKQ